MILLYMNIKIIFLILIILIILILTIGRKTTYKSITNLDKKGKYNINTNYLYDDYFENLEANEGKDLVGNFGIIRYNFMDQIYNSDIKIADIKDNQKILNLSLTNCNFDIFLTNKFKNIDIYSLINNIHDFKLCNDKINSLNLEYKIKIVYGKYSDLGNLFKNQKFDRIILLESFGKIKNRDIFIPQLKSLLKDDNSFIYLKTIVFKDLILDERMNKEIKNEIYEKQTKMIKFWNYNFSSKQSIINDFLKLGFKDIKYKNISSYRLFFTYNMEDIFNLLKLYFVDLDLGIKDLEDWFILFGLDLVNFIIK
jgi:hypothetical protein